MTFWVLCGLGDLKADADPSVPGFIWEWTSGVSGL